MTLDQIIKMSFNILFHEPSIKSYCIVVRTAAQAEPSLTVFILNKDFARNVYDFSPDDTLTFSTLSAFNFSGTFIFIKMSPINWPGRAIYFVLFSLNIFYTCWIAEPYKTG